MTSRFFVDDRYVLTAILLNAAVLFLLGFPELASNPVLLVLDPVFTTYFVVEAFLKVRQLSWRGYVADAWNRFDGAIVLFSLPSYLLFFTDLPDLTWLYLVRLVRLLKFFRYFRFVPQLEQLLVGVRRAVRTSGMVIVAMFLFTLIISLVNCHLFGGLAPARFGDPLASFYTTFQVFTIEGWNDIPDDVTEHLTGGWVLAARLWFMAMVVGGGLLGLSIVNAIFVDEMLRNENDALEAHMTRIDARIEALHADVRRLAPRAEGTSPSGDGDSAG